jgi:phage-related protein
MKLKELFWVGSSEKDLYKFPDDVIDTMLHGITVARAGEKSTHAKVLKGFGGANVIELIDDDRSGTYRTVYTIKMADAVFVLHAFQKKSKQGIKTPQRDMDLIESRLKRAQEFYKNDLKKK